MRPLLELEQEFAVQLEKDTSDSPTEAKHNAEISAILDEFRLEVQEQLDDISGENSAPLRLVS